MAMAQKSHFKAVETDTYIKRYTFPQLPFAELENPKYLKTHLGGKLLLGGLWGYLRKPSTLTNTTFSLSPLFLQRLSRRLMREVE